MRLALLLTTIFALLLITEVENIKNEVSSFANNYICSTSNNNTCMHNDELNHVKDRISSLDSTLKKCIVNNDKLMDLCAKSCVNTSKSNTHYTNIYSKIYSRKDHLAKL
ncbi:uncharacterized protein A4U43_C05F16140 [Asparagus officinalis]|uniref:Pectinesterase inhibitor domain-containing protein n=1 Tax=Asparagus officinalis TaxID=4686 RepID=A0A5P1ERZ0_ASPOF|nr:uncharacterized protein A4U43_C05F16140 [Asparagus officinalis]